MPGTGRYRRRAARPARDREDRHHLGARRRDLHVPDRRRRDRRTAGWRGSPAVGPEGHGGAPPPPRERSPGATSSSSIDARRVQHPGDRGGRNRRAISIQGTRGNEGRIGREVQEAARARRRRCTTGRGRRCGATSCSAGRAGNIADRTRPATIGADGSARLEGLSPQRVDVTVRRREAKTCSTRARRRPPISRSRATAVSRSSSRPSGAASCT